MPYAVNLFARPPTALVVIVQEHWDSISRGDYLNGAVAFWELPLLPSGWIPALDAMDVIVAVSEAMRCTFQFALSGPLIVGGLLPLQLPERIAPDRRRFALSEEATVFATSFETHSDLERKNPYATIDAFLKGVGDLPNAHLIIRINNAETTSEHPVLGDIRQRCAGHPRIKVLTEALSYVDALSLYASCDVSGSFHRAEGRRL